MVLKWFDISEVDALATSLASEFCLRISPSDLAADVRGGKRRLTDASDALLKRVEKFASTRKLNLYKRARLANTIKWKLIEAGYDGSLVDALTLDVAKCASLANRPAR